MSGVRYPLRFESLDASIILPFSRAEMEWETSEPLAKTLESVVGKTYAIRTTRNATPLPEVASEVVRYMLLGCTGEEAEQTVRDIKSKARRIGLGRFWTRHPTMGDHWAYVDIGDMPKLQFGKLGTRGYPIIWTFNRLSDFFAKNETVVTETVNVASHDFTINNPGNITASIMIITFASNSGAGFTNPRLENLTNGYSIGSLRDAASADDAVKIDTDKLSLEYSTDNGITYAYDFANRVIGGNQAQWMRLEPGNNSMRATSDGTPDYTLTVSFYAPYA